MQDEEHKTGEKLVQAYRQMMDRVRHAMKHAKTDTLPTVHQHIDAAMDKAVELEELTREEAEHIGDYLRRDIHDAAEYLADTQKELGDWMRFDLDIIEDRLLKVFGGMVDQTRQELDKLAERAYDVTAEWRAGEITGPGALCCDNCGEENHYHQPSRISPCPKCQGTLFRRLMEDDVAEDSSSNEA